MQACILFAFLLVALTAQSTAEDTASLVDSLIVQAQTALSGQDYKLAADLLLGAVEASPEHENANALLGSCYLALQRPDLADGFLFTALRASEFSNVGAASNLAESLRQLGDTELAVRLLQHTLHATNRSDLSGLLEYSLGGLLREQGRDTEAGEWYLAAALLQPKNPQYWLSASTLGLEEGAMNLTVAENVLAQGLLENPMHPDLLAQLGLVMQRSGRLNEACVLYHEALRLSPDNPLPVAAQNLATALHSLGRGAEALSAYQAALGQAPASVVLLQNYAALLHSLERPHEAVEAMEAAVALLPPDGDQHQHQHQEARMLLAEYTKLEQAATSRHMRVQATVIEAALHSRWSAVVEALQFAGTPRESAGWWFFAAGMAQFFRGDYQDALACCEKARALLPPSHMALGCLGISHLYLEQAAAVPHFSAALSLLDDPAYEDPLPFLGFTMLRADLEVNLLSALRVRGDYDQCVALSLEMLALPPAEQGGVTALLFSFVDWTPSSRKHVNAFGHELTSRGELRLPAKKKLFDEALRVQNSEKKFLNVALHCVTSSPDARVQAVHQQAAAAISRIALLQPAAVPTASAGDGDGEGEGEGFVLITQFFFPPEDEEVRRNTQDVLVRNLQNPAIAQVFLVCDQDYDFSQLPQHHKITRVLLTTRLKFSDALRLASDRLAGRAVILANSDIYFDSSLGDFLARRPLPLEPDLLLALSTWTPLPASSSLQLSLRSDSQDAWLLAAPVSEEIIRQADFFFGIPRCDNRIAKIFMNSGYRVKNPAFSLHAVEVDQQQRLGQLYSKADEVLGEGADVPVADSSWS